MDISAEHRSNHNRRNCVRLEISTADDCVVLTDGRTRVKGTCMDRSAEGFGIHCDSIVPWEVGQNIMLRWHDETYEVRIAYVLKHRNCSRMGVHCVSDLASDRQAGLLMSPWQWIRLPYYRGQKDAWVVGTSFAVALCLLVAAFAIFGFGMFPGKIPARASGSVESGFGPWWNLTGGDRQPPLQNTSSRPMASGSQLSHASERLWREVVAGTRNVSWGDVETLLDLTEDQSNKLLALLNSKLAVVSSAAHGSQPDMAGSRAQLAAVLESLPDSSLSFLQQEQRRKLRDLLTQLGQL